METPWDDKVAQYLIGRSRVTLDQVCCSVGIEFPSAHQHDEIARAMKNAGWDHAAPCYGCVSFWEAGPKSLNKSLGCRACLESPKREQIHRVHSGPRPTWRSCRSYCGRSSARGKRCRPLGARFLRTMKSTTAPKQARLKKGAGFSPNHLRTVRDSGSRSPAANSRNTYCPSRVNFHNPVKHVCVISSLPWRMIRTIRL
jgi:hypothetical protein